MRAVRYASISHPLPSPLSAGMCFGEVDVSIINFVLVLTFVSCHDAQLHVFAAVYGSRNYQKVSNVF